MKPTIHAETTLTEVGPIIETLDEATGKLSKVLMILNDRTETITAKKIKGILDSSQQQLLHLMYKLEDEQER